MQSPEVAGAVPFNNNQPEDGESRKVAQLWFHAEQDEHVPFSGGWKCSDPFGGGRQCQDDPTLNDPNSPFRFFSAAEQDQRWASHNGCSGEVFNDTRLKWLEGNEFDERLPGDDRLKKNGGHKMLADRAELAVMPLPPIDVRRKKGGAALRTVYLGCPGDAIVESYTCYGAAHMNVAAVAPEGEHWHSGEQWVSMSLDFFSRVDSFVEEKMRLKKERKKNGLKQGLKEELKQGLRKQEKEEQEAMSREAARLEAKENAKNATGATGKRESVADGGRM